ncbi:hypothetical protein JK628_02905 [Shewanella sp. KX20019]|uniref:hypothetical protein n=1 Tax=Shewanella sp. KX20019 TaxID=2803864 RepID=UPI00192664E1|nr:hypothetical protein [Shewanella sp. KX20019]QQX80839.1 hypothetical protein JK628_02905 [Shewanella sp. KX20019]
MGDVSKLFAMMGCRGANISGMPRGGKPSLTSEDISGALGMGNLDEGAYLIGRAKWLDDQQAGLKLYEALKKLFMAKHKVNETRATGLARLALFDVLWFKTCPTCKGGGDHFNDEKLLVTCERCGGVGSVNLTERKQSQISGVPWSTWQRNKSFAYMVDDVRIQLLNLEHIAGKHIRDYLN